MIQKILCYQCQLVILEQEVFGKLCTPTKKSTKLCIECREKYVKQISKRNKSEESRLSNSKRMKKDNPMFNPETRAKAASTITGETKDPNDYVVSNKNKVKETRQEMSERMKIDNPMFNKKTREKASKTLNEKIASGEIIYPRGVDHHLWKGNRDFNNTCRCQLYPIWTKKILERDNYTCVYCDKHGGYLQVHHIKPLREFIQEIKNKYNLNSFSKIDSNIWQKYIDEIISNHKLHDGITVCRKCHFLIDEYYREHHEN